MPVKYAFMPLPARVPKSAPALVLALFLAGCAENRASFFIELVRVPTSGDCTIESTEEGLYRTGGSVDLAYSSGYMFTPLLKNQLSPRASQEGFVAETNGILVEGANIRIWQGGRPQGEAFYSFYQPAASYVPPGGVTASSFVAIPTQATGALLLARFPEYGDVGSIPNGELRAYRDLVTLGVSMLGTTNGGVELETPEFYFPVQVCFGCLTRCTTDSQGETGEYCTSTDAPTDTPCFPGQDEGIDCRLCAPIYGAETCRGFCGM